MQENKYPLSIWRIILLIFLYFIVYKLIYPYIFTLIALSQNPDLKVFPLIYQIAIYTFTLLPAIYLAYPLLYKERYFNISKVIKSIFFVIISGIILNFIFAMFMNIIGGPQDSVNQSGLNSIMYESVPLYALMVGVLAPMLEEIIFRGVLYRGIKTRYGVIIALLISSFMFGYIHVSSSILIGNFGDALYLLLYGAIGAVFAFAYEYNQSIWACIVLHSSYNLFALMLMLL